MGYTTTFQGQLRFVSELTASQLAHLSSFLGEDRRDHPEWDATDKFYYVDLELTEDFGGLRHSGVEKTYGMVEIVNTIVRLMQEKWPDFQLTGSLDAQGEEWDDRWTLVINSEGLAESIKKPIEGKVVECPHCEEKFVLEDSG